jgi:hypothetical protein
MDFWQIYNLLISYLVQPVSKRVIEMIGFLGLILATYGAILLIKPLVKSNAEIKAISSYKNSGAILGMEHKIEINKKLKKDLEESRNIAFKGGMFIFAGFIFQVLEKAINLIPIPTMPQGMNWFFFIILIIAYSLILLNVLKKMKKKKEFYEKDRQEKVQEKSRLIKTLKKEKNSEKNFRTLIFIVLSLIGLIGLICIWYSNQLNEYLTYPPYPDDLQHYGIYIYSPAGEDKPLYLYDTSIIQYFSENKAQFYFEIYYPTNITGILFDFPVNITDPSFRCYFKNSTDDSYNKIPFQSFNCSILYSRKNTTTFLEFNKTHFEEETVLIEYNLELKPIGFFEISTNQMLDYGVRGNLILNLGKDYECVSDCIYPWQNIELAPRDEMSQIRILNFQDPDKNRNFIFKITTRSNKIVSEKNILLSLGISLIVGALSGLISFWIYKHEKDNSKIS